MHNLIGLICTIGVLTFVGYAFYRSIGVKPRRGSNSSSDAYDIITDHNRHLP